MTNYENNKLVNLLMGMTSEEKESALDILNNWETIKENRNDEELLKCTCNELKNYGVDITDYKVVAISLIKLMIATREDIYGLGSSPDSEVALRQVMEKFNKHMFWFN